MNVADSALRGRYLTIYDRLGVVSEDGSVRCSTTTTHARARRRIVQYAQIDLARCAPSDRLLILKCSPATSTDLVRLAMVIWHA